jgi:Xaa-Pro aminopeptidase
MKKHSADAYLITGLDAHQSEYSYGYWHTRPFVSGFTGSAGSIVITRDNALLWTDGRYFLQAEKELREGFTLLKLGQNGTPEVYEWFENLPEASVIAYDGRTVSAELAKKIRKHSQNNFKFRSDLDLISEIWTNRPEIQKHEIYEHEPEFSGKSHAGKLDEVRQKMRKIKADAYIISSLDDIAWLYNFRGSDLEFTPVAYAYAFITLDAEFLFVGKDFLLDDLKENLLSCDVNIKDYDDFYSFISDMKPDKNIKNSMLKHPSVLINPQRVNVLIRKHLEERMWEIVESADITTNLKAIKNETELQNLEVCQICDGAAVTKFIIWLKENIQNLSLRESEIHDNLFEFRKILPHYMGASFSTIAAYMENAALMHYNPQKGADAKIENKGFLLIDSGAQYKNGTTDITRTIVLGEVSDEMKRDFTLVLKSHIALAKAKWLYGATGAELDIFARKPMWENAMDYKSGTGHGLGYFLNVHEGPQRFSQSASGVKIEAGMVTTNEPGIYREGKWGIRTENTVVAQNDSENEFGRFMKFKTVSYVPIDLDAVEADMLTEEEIEWVNSYHKTVYEKISDGLNASEREVLKRYTREI